MRVILFLILLMSNQIFAGTWKYWENYDEWYNKKFNANIQLNLNITNASFNEEYFSCYIPQTKWLAIPSIKFLFQYHFKDQIRLNMGVEYRYDYIRTKYILEVEKDDWGQDYIEYKKETLKEYLDYELPDKTTIKIHNLVFTVGLELAWFAMEFGYGIGNMVFENSPFYFKLKDNVSINNDQARRYLNYFENDFLVPYCSFMTSGSWSVYIRPHRNYILNFQIVHNFHKKTQHKSDIVIEYYGTTETTSHIDYSIAPIYGMITFSYIFNLFTLGE